MPKVDLLNIEGKKVGNIELSDDIFAVEVNEDVMHEVVVNYLALLETLALAVSLILSNEFL